MPLNIEPFPAAAKLRRGAADLVPVVTAESRYLENETLTKLPAEQLVKVVPTPIETIPLTGHVRLRSSTKVFYESPLSNEAEFLADALKQLIIRRGRRNEKAFQPVPRPPTEYVCGSTRSKLRGC